jgi:dTDP-4-amino-4,6-dideoxygalactose transaminase
MNIPFNKPYLTGKETHYIYDAVNSGKISGNGKYTQKCQDFFQLTYGFKKCLLTTSCTDALEMCAILLDIQPGDEVILPAYTFVSTANAFVLRGAKLVFADSCKENPNIDAASLLPLISSKTKAIVIVHYAGIACDMDAIMAIANERNLFVVEDAAQAIDSYYNQRPLGSIGHLSAFSFHETKNIISGEGGMLVINDNRFIQRAEIIWEKGTNRSAFFRGEVDKYGWVDIGSSFLPSEIVSAFLFAQLENIEDIQSRRKDIWSNYNNHLKVLARCGVGVPSLPSFATNNAHIYYLVSRSLEERQSLIKTLRAEGILAVFHYVSLHKSEFYVSKHDGRRLENCDLYADRLLRLPLFYTLQQHEQDRIIEIITDFYK